MFILRAAPGTGKSSWVKNNGLEHLTVSSDDWRVRINGIAYNDEGKPYIPQDNQQVVWDRVRREIRHKMESGEDVILDACARTAKEMRAWQDLTEELGYESYVVEFWREVDEQTCKERNRGREEMRQVPEYVIERFYQTASSSPVPDGLTGITPEEALALLGVEEQTSIRNASGETLYGSDKAKEAKRCS